MIQQIFFLCQGIVPPVAHHKWLLSEEVDLLPSLLLPLAGPEQFDEDDMEKLPEDLQYLADDKTREPDPDIRKMLLEALLKVNRGLHVYFLHGDGKQLSIEGSIAVIRHHTYT